jgi:hypothetical protein
MCGGAVLSQAVAVAQAVVLNTLCFMQPYASESLMFSYTSAEQSGNIATVIAQLLCPPAFCF